MAQKDVETAYAKLSALRLLLLTPATDSKTSPSPFPSFLKTVTSERPAPDISTFAGYTSHPPLHLKTKYYETDVGIWCDELPTPTAEPSPGSKSTLKAKPQPIEDDSIETPTQDRFTLPPQSESKPTLSEWQSQMLSDTAREVRDVIGGIIVLLPINQQTISSAASPAQLSQQIASWLPYIEAVTLLRDATEDESGRDVASIVVLQDMTSPHSPASSAQLEALHKEMEEEYLSTHGVIGWDYVLWKPDSQHINAPSIRLNAPTVIPSQSTRITARNKFGEKTGFPRILEVLEGIDWNKGPTSTTPTGQDDTEDLIGPNPLDFLDSPSGLSKHSYSNINKSSRPRLGNATGVDMDITDSHLAQENRGLQRELLGLKMAMLDADKTDSGPSSLAGEYDVGDFGARTPMPLPGSRLGSSTTVDTTDDSVGGAKDKEDEEEDEAMQVEQLTHLMEQVKSLREAAEGMSGIERERFARREVNRIVKKL